MLDVERGLGELWGGRPASCGCGSGVVGGNSQILSPNELTLKVVTQLVPVEVAERRHWVVWLDCILLVARESVVAILITIDRKRCRIMWCVLRAKRDAAVQSGGCTTRSIVVVRGTLIFHLSWFGRDLHEQVSLKSMWRELEAGNYPQELALVISGILAIGTWSTVTGITTAADLALSASTALLNVSEKYK